VLRVDHSPVYLEPLTLRTWCSATGPRWAERRVSVGGARGGAVEAASLWVSLDPVNGRPAKLTAQFQHLFAPSTQGRSVSARLLLPGSPPPDASGREREPVDWQPRFADFDVLGHVNNAAYWTVLEQLLVHRRELRAPMMAVVEHAQPIEPDVAVRVEAVHRPGVVDAWITAVDDGRTLAVLHVESS
jgi:acyl-ACP thioesterase